MRADKLLDERIRQRFPFQLTHAQQNAVWQIVHDLRSGRPMNRLLQGDVGSGKTVVALYAMLVAVANKMQAAILAPTEVLAEQHFLTLSRLLEGSSVRIELFTQRTKRESRGKLPKELAAAKCTWQSEPRRSFSRTLNSRISDWSSSMSNTSSAFASGRC